MRYYRHTRPEETFDPEAHLWLAEPAEGVFFYVGKESDSPGPLGRERLLDRFRRAEPRDVPWEVRRRAVARWAAWCLRDQKRAAKRERDPAGEEEEG